MAERPSIAGAIAPWTAVAGVRTVRHVGIVGAELASLMRLEAAVARHGAALEELRAALAAEIAAAEWQGRAADRFRSQWSEDHEPSLRRLETALHEAAAEVSRRRAAIEAAGA